MHPVERRAISDAVSPPLSLPWALLVGVGGASLLALAVSAQVYLSMLHHGHSFIRIAAWQLCSWSVWAAATPVVLRLGSRLSERSGPMAGGYRSAAAPQPKNRCFDCHAEHAGRDNVFT